MGSSQMRGTLDGRSYKLSRSAPLFRLPHRKLACLPHRGWNIYCTPAKCRGLCFKSVIPLCSHNSPEAA